MSEHFTHPYILINAYNKKFSKITLNKDTDNEDEYDVWRDFLDDVLEYSKEHRCWVLNNTELDDFIYMVKNANKKNRFGSRRRDDSRSREESQSESSETSESSESSSSSSEDSEDIDDETIQKALARRLMSDSKQLEIESSHISDSEMEDVISSVRRLRYIYRVIDKLSKRVEELEVALGIHKRDRHQDDEEKTN